MYAANTSIMDKEHRISLATSEFDEEIEKTMVKVAKNLQTLVEVNEVFIFNIMKHSGTSKLHNDISYIMEHYGMQ